MQNLKANNNSQFSVKRVLTLEDAQKIAELYIPYFRRVNLGLEMFLSRWKNANNDSNYYMLAAYSHDFTKPIGFIDFSIIPSIFWGPCLARIDSVHVQDESLENEVFDELFKATLSIMNSFSVSKIIAVSCENYPQEIRLLSKKMDPDNNPSKAFLTLDCHS